MGILTKFYQTYSCPECNCGLAILTDDKGEAFGLCRKEDAAKCLREWQKYKKKGVAKYHRDWLKAKKSI